MLKYFFLFYCLLFFLSASAQLNIDSLTKAIEVAPDDTNKVFAYSDVILEISYSNRKQATKLSDEAMLLAEKLNYQKGKAIINNLYGVLQLDAGNLDSAQLFFLKSLEINKEVGYERGEFNVLKKLGEVHVLRNSFDIAKDYYDQAFDMAKSMEDDRLLGSAYNSLGTFFINQGWHFKDNYNDSIKSDSLFRVSVPYLEKASYSFKKANYERGAALAFANMAIIQLEFNDLARSKFSMQKSAIYFDSLGLKMYLVSAYNHLTEIYFREKNYDSALYQVEKTLALAEELDSKFDIRNAYGKYSYIYRATKQYQKYIESHSLYDDYNMQLLDEQKQAAIDELEIKYNTESQQQQLEIQRAENDKQKLILITIIVVAISLIILISFLIRKNQRERHFKKILIHQTEELKSINEEMSTQRDQLEQANQKLQEINEEQNNIMAVVAHDLRSPLNKVKGLTGVMGMTSLSAEQKDINSKSMKVAEQGLELIADIMKLKEYEGELDLTKEELNIKDLLQEIMSNHQSYASRKNINLELKANNNDFIFITDKLLFTRIIDNLISNAVKFSEPSSVVSIELELANELRVAIKDNGPGFTKDDLKNVFKRFKKLSARPTGGESSSGLGLSIVKTLVEKLEGTITLASKEGEGSTFMIKLPS